MAFTDVMQARQTAFDFHASCIDFVIEISCSAIVWSFNLPSMRPYIPVEVLSCREMAQQVDDVGFLIRCGLEFDWIATLKLNGIGHRCQDSPRKILAMIFKFYEMATEPCDARLMQVRG